MNRPWVCMCSPILNPPPTPLLTYNWVVPEHWLWVPCFMHQTYTGVMYFLPLNLNSDTDLYNQLSWFLGLQSWTGNYITGSPGVGVLSLLIN